MLSWFSIPKKTGEPMAELVYVLCTLMSLACAGLLLRGYRKDHSQLLLWSSLCFVALAVNNAVLFVDMIVLPDIDFGGQLWRNAISAIAGSLLLFGLIWELT